MRLPTMLSTIERRLLVNWRADPDVIAPLLPEPFRPQVVAGHAVVGVCLIRLDAVRPRGVPAKFGLRSESAAHRIAVEWRDENGGPRTGVYVVRRDTSSRLTALAGGRAFPGVHRRARFDVDETAAGMRLAFVTADGTAVDVAGSVSESLDSGLFADLDVASVFFRGGSVGYSPRRDGRGVDGVELVSADWTMAPIALDRGRSSIWDDRRRLPRGSVELDSAFVMSDLDVTWRRVPSVHSHSMVPGGLLVMS